MLKTSFIVLLCTYGSLIFSSECPNRSFLEKFLKKQTKMNIESLDEFISTRVTTFELLEPIQNRLKEELEKFWEHAKNNQKKTQLYLDEQDEKTQDSNTIPYTKIERHLLLFFYFLDVIFPNPDGLFSLVQKGDRSSKVSLENWVIESNPEKLISLDSPDSIKKILDSPWMLEIMRLVHCNNHFMYYVEFSCKGNKIEFVSKKKERLRMLSEWVNSLNHEEKYSHHMMVKLGRSVLSLNLDEENDFLQFVKNYDSYLFLELIFDLISSNSDDINEVTIKNIENFIRKTITKKYTSSKFLSIDLDKYREDNKSFDLNNFFNSKNNICRMLCEVPSKKQIKNFRFHTGKIIHKMAKKLSNFFPKASLVQIKKAVLTSKFHFSGITKQNFYDDFKSQIDANDQSRRFEKENSNGKYLVLQFAENLDHFLTIETSMEDSDPVADVYEHLEYNDLGDLIDTTNSLLTDSSIEHAPNIHISWSSVMYPSFHRGVLVHEVAHKIWYELVSLEESGNDEVVRYMKVLRKHLSEIHPYAADPSLYAKEDFCDAVAAKMFPGSYNLGLLIFKNSMLNDCKNPLENTDPSDTHSSAFFRILHIHYLQKKGLPSKMSSYLYKFFPKQEFRDCLDLSMEDIRLH